MFRTSVRISSWVVALPALCWTTSSTGGDGRMLSPTVIASAQNADCKPGDFPVTCPTRDDWNEAITQFDLVAPIGLTGRVARMHYSVLAPGGIIGLHPHRNRPCFEYILQGVATETKQGGDGRVVVRRLRRHEVEREGSDITHWWKNETRQMVRMIAIDIFADTNPVFWRAPGVPRTMAFTPPATSGSIRIEPLGSIDMGVEFPDVEATKYHVMRSRRFTLRPHQSTPVYRSRGRPAFVYVVQGNVVEQRSDQEPSVRRPEDFLIEDADISYYWENPTSELVVLWVVDFVDRNVP